jgi:flavodoxin
MPIARLERTSAVTKYLVAYYSWTGHTAKVANLIAELLSADIEQIHDVKPRIGPFVFAAAAFSSVLHRSAPISRPTKSVAEYDVVILGCPVWASNMATPMRSYITQERSGIKQIGLFCTLGGSGGKAALAQMAALCGRTSLANLLVDQPALASDMWRGLAENFAHEVGKNEVTSPGAAPRGNSR